MLPLGTAANKNTALGGRKPEVESSPALIERCNLGWVRSLSATCGPTLGAQSLL